MLVNNKVFQNECSDQKNLPFHDNEKTLVPCIDILIDVDYIDDVAAVRRPPVELNFATGFHIVS